jgi:ATP-binding cassette subfamily F protein uup
LQELLADYPGTVLLVSHDRDFLDRVVTSILAFGGDGRWVEYAGGYSDMLAQCAGGRPETAAPALSARPRAAAAPPAAAAPSRKLSFKDKHALATLPARMAALQEELRRARTVLGDADLYVRDPQAFRRASETLARGEQELAAAEERWLELELLREEVEGR